MTAAARERVAAAQAVIERSRCLGPGGLRGEHRFRQPRQRPHRRRRSRDPAERLVLSHAAGGEPLPDPAVRGMLLLRASTLIKGRSGVRRCSSTSSSRPCSTTICCPRLPSRGSVGASGDLAPLAHRPALLGRGPRAAGREVRAGRRALRDAGLAGAPRSAGRTRTGPGTQAMTSLLALAALSKRVAWCASPTWSGPRDRRCEAPTPPSTSIHAVRPLQPARQRAISGPFLQGSEIRGSHRAGDVRVRDPYSLRHAAGARRGARHPRRRRAAPGDRDELGDRQSAGFRGGHSPVGGISTAADGVGGGLSPSPSRSSVRSPAAEKLTTTPTGPRRSWWRTPAPTPVS